jgi:hypothetical protein
MGRKSVGVGGKFQAVHDKGHGMKVFRDPSLTLQKAASRVRVLIDFCCSQIAVSFANRSPRTRLAAFLSVTDGSR